MSKYSNNLAERIAQNYTKLTENSRRIANYLQLNPEKILMQSTAEIASACEVSKASVSRFIRQLGYDDHLALRNELMGERERGTPVLTSSLDDSSFQQEFRALEQLWAQLNSMDLQPLIQEMADAKRIKIIGYRNSYPVALHLRQQLMQCRQNVELLPTPGQTLGEDLAAINEDDLVIVIGIRRRVKQFAQVIDHLATKRVLLITDQSGQQYADSVSHTLICCMDNHMPLDSYAVPMSLISYLVNKLYIHLGPDAALYSSKISGIYTQLDELE